MHSGLDVSYLTLDSSMLGVYPELVQPWVERRHFQRMSCATLRWWTSWWEVSVSFMIVGTYFNFCPWHGGVSRGWAGIRAVTAAVLPGSPVPAGDAAPAVQGGQRTHESCVLKKQSILLMLLSLSLPSLGINAQGDWSLVAFTSSGDQLGNLGQGTRPRERAPRCSCLPQVAAGASARGGEEGGGVHRAPHPNFWMPGVR